MEAKSTFVLERIKQIPEGTVITFASLYDGNIQASALAVIISRFVRQGVLKRLSKGRYAKPRQTRFGTLLPSDQEVLESILKPTSNKYSGYISGLAAYNRLGLTTQIPNELLVVGPTSSRQSKIGKLRLRFIRSNIPITEETKGLLPILDALRDLKKIPDTSTEDVILKLRNIILQLTITQKSTLVELAIYYAPRVRAMLGSILEVLQEKQLSETLKRSLNPLSTYFFDFDKPIFHNFKSWNIR